MSISINNNTTSLIAQRNLQKAAVDSERAVARLSSGKASAFPGDRVAETAIAITLSSNVEIQKVALTTAAQASQSIEIAYAATEEQLGILGQLQSIAAQTSSDTMSDVERKSMERQFTSLKNLVDLIAEQTNYNGTTMLTGGYTGASHIHTNQSVSKMVYDITRPDQYITHGVVSENPVLEKNTTVQVVDKIGKDKATGFIEFSEDLKLGDKIVINGRTFTAVDASILETAMKEDDFKLGCCLKETLQNLVKTLNLSKFSEVTPATYRIENTKDVDLCDPNAPNPNANGCGTGAHSSEFRLAVDYNMAGSIGNEFTIGTALASPIDKGFQAAAGSLRFDYNLLSGDKILIGGVEMVATENAVDAAKNDKNFLIGKNTSETMKNLADKLNSSRIAEISKAKYTAMKNGISVDYIKQGFEGNKFTIGATTKAADANTITADQLQVLRAGVAAKAAVVFTAAIAEDDTITIDGITFTAVVAGGPADPKQRQFEGGINADAIIDSLKAAVAEYVKANPDLKEGDNGFNLANITLAAATATLTISYTDKYNESKGNGIAVAAAVTANVAINGGTAAGTATGVLKGGLDHLDSGTGSIPKAAIVFSTLAADAAYNENDKIKLNGTEFKFVTAATPNTAENEVVYTVGAATADTLNDQMKKLVEKFNTLKDADPAKKAKLEYYAGTDANGTALTDQSTLVITYNEVGAAGNDYSFVLGNGAAATDVKYGFDTTTPAAKAAAEEKIADIPVTNGFGAAGSQHGVDKKDVASRVNVNDTYFDKSSGNPVTNTLNGGESVSIGKKATLVVDFNPDKNFTNDKQLTLGSLDYVFKSVPPAAAAGNVLIGTTLTETMRNLVQVVNNDTRENKATTTGEIAKFKLYYNEDTHLLTIVNDIDPEKNSTDGGVPIISSDDTAAQVKLTNTGAYTAVNAALLVAAAAGTMKSIIDNAGTNAIDGTHLGVDRVILKNTNKVNINNTGEAIPNNGIASGTLISGTDQTTGQYASVKVDFSTNGTNNFSDGDRITLNGEEFTFTVNTIKDALGNETTIPLSQTAVDIGGSIDDALNNLAIVVNASKNKSADAILQYEKGTHQLFIQSKTTGVAANDYSFNFGDTQNKVNYNVGNGPTSESKLITIRDVAKNNVDFGTMGTENYATLFPQNMKGDISELKAIFKPGDAGKNNDQFIHNSVQFFVRVNGETYQTGDITLSGGNKKDDIADGYGYRNLGNFIAGGTKLYFQRVGGDPTEAGFNLTVKQEGINLGEPSSSEEAQKTLNDLMSGASHAIQAGGLSIGIGVKGSEIKSYGLRNIDQFVGSGSALRGSHLTGNIEVYGSTGLTKAQGVIEFKNNAFQNGDYIMLNGTKVIAEQDFKIGNSLAETMDNIISALNRSHDNNVAQAFYSKSADDRLIITYKQAGDIGNNFKISASFVDRCGVDHAGKPIDKCDPNAIDQSKINGVKINGNLEYLSSTNEMSLSEKDPTVNDKYVVLGENKKSVDDIMPAYLMGAMSDLKIELIEGYSSTENGSEFTPNSLKFSTVVNCNTYAGQIDLSGGNIANGIIDGKGYNGFGNFLAGGSKIILNSIDGTHSIALTLDTDGLTLPGSIDDNTSKNDVLRELSKIETSMNHGLIDVVINQKRQVSSFDVMRTFSTVLRGIKAENVYYQAPDFDLDGKGGLISSFKVDNVGSKISVTIGGRVYSQDLAQVEEEGGLGANYDSVNKIIKGGLGTTFILATENDNSDARALVINLQGVSDIDISTEQGVKALEEGLNSAFGASDGSGLRFQIGIKPTDLITLTFPDVTTKALFRDDNGQYSDISVLTRENAIESGKVIHNAMDKLRQERASIGATQAQFESVSNNLRTSIRALQASRSVLEDADIAEVSSEYALAAMRMNAASTAFAHGISSLRDMVSRILQM